ncbi:MAG: tetratricopeptide repeat protein [Ottowia sp.]|nr:tetratricopeptide repeat protein [Ottowia sp.]
MRLDFSTPTALQYFAMLVENDSALPLLEAAASLAQDDYPELDLQQVLSDVDRLSVRARRRVDTRTSALGRLYKLGRFFFDELGFGGNVNDYYNVENSYLHRVLERRRGIPISLAVIWLEVARNLDLQAEGVSFPGHFLVQAHVGQGRVVVDPFTGESLSSEQLRERLDELSLLPPGESAHDHPLLPYLEPTTPRQILARMLGNLQAIHRSREDWPRLVAVQDRLITLLPQAWAEYRNRGLALAELGQDKRARADLSLYLDQAGQQASDRHKVIKVLQELDG